MGAYSRFALSNFGIQNSDLGEDQLNGIELRTQAENTKRTTECEAKRFEKWCDKRQPTLNFTTIR